MEKDFEIVLETIGNKIPHFNVIPHHTIPAPFPLWVCQKGINRMENSHWNKNGFIILGCSGCEKTDFSSYFHAAGGAQRPANSRGKKHQMETCVLRRANTCIRWTLVWRWDWMVVYGNFYANFASHLTNFFPPRRGSGWGRGHVDWKFNARGTTCLYEFIRNVNLLWLSATTSFPPTADRLSGRIVLWERVEKKFKLFQPTLLVEGAKGANVSCLFQDASIWRQKHFFPGDGERAASLFNGTVSVHLPLEMDFFLSLR